MTATSEPKRKYTIEKYIELLLHSAERFEYFDGEVISMAGGKFSRGSIGANLVRAIGNLLAERPCQALNGDVAIKTILAPPAATQM